MPAASPGWITAFLQRAPAPVLNIYAMSAAFMTYFCMYAFRKPFSAATYEGFTFFDTQIELKTAFVISQIVGYALSKYLGIKFCPEVTRRNRGWVLFTLICVAELALVLFAIVPTNLKIVAIFLNGLPLGMVWGLVVWYLEGRRTSEILLAVLSCSFIIASGVVKDIGRSLLDGMHLLGIEALPQIPAVTDFWMPAVTGLLFLPPFLLSLWLLDQVPEPTEEDTRERSQRETMTVDDRKSFVMRFFTGIFMLTLAYVSLTAFRDFRDNYTVDILIELGLEGEVAAISSMETGIAFGVLLVMGSLYFIKDNHRAMVGIFGIVIVGFLMIGCSTWLLEKRILDGYSWMLMVGLGCYLAYVPHNSVLFDRLMASTRAIGTAVFAIYIADALGYTGSVVVQLFKDLFVGDMSRLEFLKGLSYFVSLSGSALTFLSAIYFLRQPNVLPESSQPLVPDSMATYDEPIT